MTELNIKDDIEVLLNDVAKDIDEIIDSSNVVGERITVGDTTIVPLMAAGFGFGAGGSTMSKEGAGEGTGGGGGVKPVAVVVINPEGVTVSPVPGAPSGIEKLGSAIGEALKKRDESD